MRPPKLRPGGNSSLPMSNAAGSWYRSAAEDRGAPGAGSRSCEPWITSIASAPARNDAPARMIRLRSFAGGAWAASSSRSSGLGPRADGNHSRGIAGTNCRLGSPLPASANRTPRGLVCLFPSGLNAGTRSYSQACQRAPSELRRLIRLLARRSPRFGRADLDSAGRASRRQFSRRVNVTRNRT
jgi:hypothetical protein